VSERRRPPRAPHRWKESRWRFLRNIRSRVRAGRAACCHELRARGGTPRSATSWVATLLGSTFLEEPDNHLTHAFAFRAKHRLPGRFDTGLRPDEEATDYERLLREAPRPAPFSGVPRCTRARRALCAGASSSATRRSPATRHRGSGPYRKGSAWSGRPRRIACWPPSTRPAVARSALGWRANCRRFADHAFPPSAHRDRAVARALPARNLERGLFGSTADRGPW
jgi:hypothetical protein